MKKNENRELNIDKLFKAKEVAILILMTSIISVLYTLSINMPVKIDEKNPETSKDANLENIIKQYNYIKENFYDINGKVTENDIVEGAIKGMMSALGDQYSAYIPVDDNTYNITLEGEYQGLGIEIAKLTDNKIHIITVFEDSPAAKSGLKEGDIINSLDGETVDNLTTEEFGNKVKKGTSNSYKIGVIRNDEEIIYNIERSRVIINSVKSEIINKDDKKVGYIIVDVFANNTDVQFKNALSKLEAEKIDSLIIDLRGNTGGHLNSVEKMVSEFLDSTHVIYQMDKKGEIEKAYSKGKVTKKYPIVLICNSGSASASELMIGALTEEYGAKLVGTNSFGKGTAQELIEIGNGNSYKITTKKWLTPKGEWINGTGFTPDYVIELGESYYENPTKENDNQLQKALELAVQG